MGSSVYSSFLLPSLLSGRMTLKTIFVLCLFLVVFIEAKPKPWNDRWETVEDDGWQDTRWVNKRSSEPETGNEMNDAPDTKSNESEDTTDDSEQVDDMDTSGKMRRSPCYRYCKGCQCTTP